MFLFKKAKQNEIFIPDNKYKEINTLKASKLAKNALNSLSILAGELGSRKAGSEETKKAASMLATLFEPKADSVVLSEDKVILSTIDYIHKVIAISVPIILLANLFSLSILSSIVFGLVTYLYIYDTILLQDNKIIKHKKATMHNVHAIIEPRDPVEKTIVLTAHHDAARLFNPKVKSYFYLICLIHYIVLGIMSCLFFLYDLFTLEIFTIQFSFTFQTFINILFILSSFIYYYLFNYLADEYSPAIGDNLSSCCILTEIANYFKFEKENTRPLNNTRLIFASFDGEEIGLKGSSVWYKNNKDLLINAENINLDTLYNEDSLYVLNQDANGFQELSKELASKLSSYAHDMGFKAKAGKARFSTGATDAVAAAREGVEAASIVALDNNSPLHTAEDTQDKISPKVVEIVISILIKYIKNNDQKLIT